MGLASVHVLDAGGAAVLEDDLSDMGVAEELEVGEVSVGLVVG